MPLENKSDSLPAREQKLPRRAVIHSRRGVKKEGLARCTKAGARTVSRNDELQEGEQEQESAERTLSHVRELLLLSFTSWQIGVDRGSVISPSFYDKQNFQPASTSGQTFRTKMGGARPLPRWRLNRSVFMTT